MAVDSSSIVSALGGGSGINIRDLAKGLTDAEKVPKQNAIQAKIDKSEAKISGYSAMMAALNVFKGSIDQIDSTTDFAATSVRNSNPSAFSVTTTSLAAPGAHSIEVHSLARAQRSVSDGGFSNVTSPLHEGQPFELKIRVGSGAMQTIAIDQTETNTSALVNKINQLGLGITAQLVDTGQAGDNRYRISLTGQSGASNSFTFAAVYVDENEETQNVAGLTFSTPANQTAADASLTVNGVTISRTTNTINDAITGVTLDLQSTTSAPASLTVSRDASGLKDKVKSIVQSYNDMVSDFGVLSGPKSNDKEDVFSGSLRGDSTVRSVLGQIRQILFGESQTKGDKIASMRDLGVTVDKNGVVTLDEATLDTAVANNFEQVVQALAGRQTATENGATVIKRGIGSDLAAKLREIMGPSGPIVNQSTSAESQVRRYQSQLETFEARMEKILERYTKQFAAMESLVGQLTAMRENLKGQFEAMAKSYGK